MDKISSILQSRGFEEPPEIRTIKDYVKQAYDSDVSVTVRDNALIIHAPSAALASTLRLRIPHLKKLLETDKRIAIHIL